MSELADQCRFDDAHSAASIVTIDDDNRVVSKSCIRHIIEVFEKNLLPLFKKLKNEEFKWQIMGYRSTLLLQMRSLLHGRDQVAYKELLACVEECQVAINSKISSVTPKEKPDPNVLVAMLVEAEIAFNRQQLDSVASHERPSQPQIINTPNIWDENRTAVVKEVLTGQLSLLIQTSDFSENRQAMIAARVILEKAIKDAAEEANSTVSWEKIVRRLFQSIAATISQSSRIVRLVFQEFFTLVSQLPSPQIIVQRYSISRRCKSVTRAA